MPWYAVLNRELNCSIRAGSIYRVVRYSEDQVHAIPVEGTSAKHFGKLFLTPTEARTIFTRPTKDFNDAVEQSFLQSEANYC